MLILSSIYVVTSSLKKIMHAYYVSPQKPLAKWNLLNSTTYFISAHKLNSIFVQNPNYARGMEPSFSINLHGNTFVAKDSDDNWSTLRDSVTLEVDQPRGSHMHWSKDSNNLCRKKEVICVKKSVIF